MRCSVDIKRLYEKHVLLKYGNTSTRRILIRSSLQVPEVKVCPRVSHGKAITIDS